MNNYDIAIIGAGAAGLTAAIYACRNNKSVVVFEGHVPGGQISESPLVENYPSIQEISGMDLSMNLLSHAEQNGAKLEYENIKELKYDTEARLVTDSGKAFNAKAVIVAVGCAPRLIGLEDENNWLGRGLGYCAVCDGNFYKGLDVAVVGGGDSALQEAIYLSSICKSVSIIHRRDEFRADSFMVNKAKKKENIRYEWNSVVKRLEGQDKLEKVILEDTITHEERELSVKGLFVAIGRIPKTNLFKDWLNLDKGGFIIADEYCRTEHPWLFVAGDCRQKNLRQLATAVSDGAVAGVEASEFVDNI